jgi:hypothetical protein
MREKSERKINFPLHYFMSDECGGGVRINAVEIYACTRNLILLI